MIRWSLVASAAAPGGGELRLMRRGEEFSIMVGADELMNSRRGGSEAALSAGVAERLTGRPASRWLIGGLGMGFTLREALRRCASDAVITVVELVPAVLGWARGPLAEIFAGGLDDARVRLVEADVGLAILAAPPGAWDAILLDVDNGPAGLTTAANDRLYTPRGLSAAYRALTGGGVLAVWSAGPDARFAARLGDAGFAVAETCARSARGRGARHVIWFATKPTGHVAPQPSHFLSSA